MSKLTTALEAERNIFDELQVHDVEQDTVVVKREWLKSNVTASNIRILSVVQELAKEKKWNTVGVTSLDYEKAKEQAYKIGYDSGMEDLIKALQEVIRTNK